MDIKKVAMDMMTKAKAYATGHKYEIGAAVGDIAFGLGMAAAGYIAGVATENQRILYNQQLIEYRKAGNHDKLTDGKLSESYNTYAKTTDKK